MRKNYVLPKLCGLFLICIAGLTALRTKQDTTHGFYNSAETPELHISELDKKLQQKSYALRFPVR